MGEIQEAVQKMVAKGVGEIESVNEVLISHAPKEDQADSGDLAHNFSLKGFTAPPKVTLNGKTVRPVSRDGQYWVTL